MRTYLDSKETTWRMSFSTTLFSKISITLKKRRGGAAIGTSTSIALPFGIMIPRRTLYLSGIPTTRTRSEKRTISPTYP